MKKVRIYQRKNRPGYYIEWRESGQRKHKQCNTKQEAEHFGHMQYMKLNSDVYTVINLTWQEVKDEYLLSYDIRGLTSASKYEAQRTLIAFEKICYPKTSQAITQKVCDWYILQRQAQKVSRYTVNKDIGRLRAFLNWMHKRGYNNNKIELTMLKVSPTAKKALTTPEIRGLFKACPTDIWRIRILLSLVTGLRSSDVDRLQVADLNLKAATVDSKSLKTGKAYIGRPLPSSAIPALKDYCNSRFTQPCTATKLLPDRNARNVWFTIRDNAGLPTVTRQDLRVTFSTYMQKISGIGTAQNLLEHSSSKTTADFYTDTELILRWKIEQLPVAEWLK